MESNLDQLVSAWAGQLWAGLLDGAGAHPTGAALIDVDSDWILDEWQRELMDRLLWQARGGSVRFVESSCGGGRTHFLQLLHNRARRCGMATVTIASERQAQVWADPLELYREVAHHLLPARQVGAAGLPALVASQSPSLAQAELFADLPGWGHALQLWAERREPEALRFLLGEPLGPAAVELGLHAPLSPRQAWSALRCLLCYLDFVGEKGLVVTGDGDGTVDPQRERETLESLRGLIDRCAGGELPGLLLAFAVLPEFRLQLLPEYEALQQRLFGGFALGPAGCLRPILVLEQQRRWRAERGIDFARGLFENLRALALRLHPRLSQSPLVLERNAQAMLDELQWEVDSLGAARHMTRTMARWLADQVLPLDTSEGASHADRLQRFLEKEAP